MSVQSTIRTSLTNGSQRMMKLIVLVTITLSATLSFALTESQRTLFSYLNMDPLASRQQIDQRFLVVAAQYEEEIRENTGGSPGYHYKAMKDSYLNVFGTYPPKPTGRATMETMLAKSPRPQVIHFDSRWDSCDSIASKNDLRPSGGHFEYLDRQGRKWNCRTAGSIGGEMILVVR